MNGFVGGNLLKRRRPFGWRMWGFAIRVMPPETVTAMDGASPSRYHQNSACVLVQKTGRKPGLLIADGIVCVARVKGGLGLHWQHLPQQRVGRITFSHPSDVTPWCEKRKRACDLTCTVGPIGWEVQDLAQLHGVAHRVFEGLLPG